MQRRRGVSEAVLFRGVLLLIRRAIPSVSGVDHDLYLTVWSSPCYSLTVGINGSSHNEAFTSQLCSSGF